MEIPNDPLNEREFELVNIIGAQITSNQRELSTHIKLSLGMTNMLLRRLVSKGYIRIRQLNKRKVEYILTPKGFSEKMRKSVKYTMKTIDSIGKIKQSLKDPLANVVQKGQRDFILVGTSDFASLVEMVLKELCQEAFTLTRMDDFPKENGSAAVLICKEEINVPKEGHEAHCINLVERLAHDYHNAHVRG